MTTIAVTGATGQLGHLVVSSLLDRGVDPASVVAIVRDPAKAADLAARGVQIREADYGQPDALRAALEGVDRLLLVSSSDVGQRLAHHVNVIDAAEAVGVGLLAYTSILKADVTTMLLAKDHQDTEQRLANATVPVVLLRNGWYVENYTGQLDVTFEHGLLGSGQDGRLNPAGRVDFAEAAAAVLVSDEDQGGRVYELAGDEAVTLVEIAASIAEAAGRPVAYVDLPVEKYAEILAGAGLPVPFNEVIADSSAAIARGELASDSRDLAGLLGRPTTPVRDVVREIVAKS
ncbi:MAG: SDR family oxidoreductase [Patulibacter sp.]